MIERSREVPLAIREAGELLQNGITKPELGNELKLSAVALPSGRASGNESTEALVASRKPDTIQSLTIAP
jgi:hypothetical protein